MSKVIVTSPEELREILSGLLTAELKPVLIQVLSEIVTPVSNTEEEYLNLDQACKFLDKKKSTIYNYIHAKSIPVIKRNNKLYFSKKKLIEWLNAGTLETRQDTRQRVLAEVKRKRR